MFVFVTGIVIKILATEIYLTLALCLRKYVTEHINNDLRYFIDLCYHSADYYFYVTDC